MLTHLKTYPTEARINPIDDCKPKYLYSETNLYQQICATYPHKLYVSDQIPTPTMQHRMQFECDD